jgi:hypothetical protein
MLVVRMDKIRLIKYSTLCDKMVMIGNTISMVWCRMMTSDGEAEDAVLLVRLYEVVDEVRVKQRLDDASDEGGPHD